MTIEDNTVRQLYHIRGLVDQIAEDNDHVKHRISALSSI